MTPETPVHGRESAREAAELVVDSLPFKLYPSNRRVSAVAAIASAIEVDRHARDAAAEARERTLREALERIEEYETDFAQGADDNVVELQNVATAALDAVEALKQGGIVMSFAGRERHSECVERGEHDGKMEALSQQLAAARAERDAEKARADRLSDARQELGVERDMIQMENEQLRASLDTSAAEVAQLRGLLREWWPEDREPHSVLARCPAAPACLMCRTQGAIAPIGAPVAGKTKGGTDVE